MHQDALESTSGDLEAILRQLTTGQIQFLVAREDYSTDKEAAESIGYSPETVKNWKYSGAPIEEARRLMALDGIMVVREILRRKGPEAAAVKVAGLTSKDERIRQTVATEVLDRALGKPGQVFQVSGPDGGPIETTVVHEHRQAILGALQRIADAGAAADVDTEPNG